jgi:hypothetical protein
VGACVSAKSTDAFLEREQGLVDLGTLNAALTIIVGSVFATLTTGQVDE